jgi:DNA-binding NarL/FixJ family response regulator
MADEIINGLIERQVAAAVERMRHETKSAVAAERERCARVCEALALEARGYPGRQSELEAAAAAIRKGE